MQKKFPTTLTHKTMIQIDIKQFEQLLPFVAAASEDVFTKMQPSFEQTYEELVTNIISSEHESEAIQEGSPLLRHVTGYVILATFLDRLHSQDIIMTDNGFGVVSNDNIAPASQARVDALVHELTYSRDMARHNILNELRRVDGWAETEQALDNIRSFFWSPVQLRQYYYIDRKLTFDDLASFRPSFDSAENFLRKQLSDGLIDQMLDEERKAKFEPNHRIAKLRILGFIATFLNKEDDFIVKRARSDCFESILRFIEEHIDDFAKYRDSNAYEANHMQAYENKSSDTTFFFA